MSEQRVVSEERRLHQRVSEVEESVTFLSTQHKIILKQLEENTAISKKAADNTQILVDIIQGAKGIRRLVLFFAPVVALTAGIAATLDWWHHHP